MHRAVLIVLAVLVFVACASKKDAGKQEPVAPVVVVVDAPPPPVVDAAEAAAQDMEPAAPDIEGVAFKFEVIPAGKLSKKKAKDALMRITVTNNSKRVIEPVRLGYSFTYDGEDSMQLNMSFGNGGFAGGWAKLPPGESATSERAGVDDFAVGTHEIVMYSWDRELARTKVTITK